MVDDGPAVPEVAFFRRGRTWVVVLVGLVAAVSTFVYRSAQPDLYRASAEVQPCCLQMSRGGPSLGFGDLDKALAQIRSPAVQDPAMESIGPSGPRVEGITASPNDDTGLVTIVAVAESAEIASEAANAVADEYGSQQDSLVIDQTKQAADQLRQSADGLQPQIDAGGVDLNKLADEQTAYRTRADELDAEAELKTTGVSWVVAPAQASAGPFGSPAWRDALVAALVAMVVCLVVITIVGRVKAPSTPLDDDMGAADGT